MKLYTSPTSPYARLVRVALVEKQLNDRVAYCFVDPWQTPAELLAVNPSCRVPTLVTDDGHALTEAGVIVLYLERRYPEPRLMPREAVEWVHTQLGRALGCIDSGVGVLTERRHGDATTALAERRGEAMQRTVIGLAEAVGSGERRDPDLGQIALGVALDWFDYRFSNEVGWRVDYPLVAQWLDALKQRPSFIQTAPPAN